MKPLPAEVYIRRYFEQRVRCYAPPIQEIILEDVDLLLRGRPAIFIEGLEDLREEVLRVFDLCRIHLSCPLMWQ